MREICKLLILRQLNKLVFSNKKREFPKDRKGKIPQKAQRNRCPQIVWNGLHLEQGQYPPFQPGQKQNPCISLYEKQVHSPHELIYDAKSLRIRLLWGPKNPEDSSVQAEEDFALLGPELSGTVHS